MSFVVRTKRVLQKLSKYLDLAVIDCDLFGCFRDKFVLIILS